MEVEIFNLKTRWGGVVSVPFPIKKDTSFDNDVDPNPNSNVCPSAKLLLSPCADILLSDTGKR
jgi:hypothetical protein